MSNYEIVNLIIAIERHDSMWLPFTIEGEDRSFALVCVRMRDGARVRFETARAWAEDITNRGIKLCPTAFGLFIGVNDVKERQKALKS